jgi:hypothetical protein
VAERRLVVDSNVVKVLLAPQSVKELPDAGPVMAGAKQIKEALESTHHLALDRKGRVSGQYGNLISMLYAEWQGILHRSDRLRFFDVKPDLSRKKRLEGVGFGRTDKVDFVLADLALVSGAEFLSTEDIEFWEPKARKWDHASKRSLQNANAGSAFSILRDDSITVRNIVGAAALL